MANVIKDMVDEFSAEAKIAYRKWLKEAREDTDYNLGYQWTAANKKTVEGEGRPALTFNEIQPIIRLVSGYQRQNRMDIKVIGVEGGDDFVAEIMTLLIKNVMTSDFGEFKVSEMFNNGIMSSKGWIEGDVSYEDDPLNGKIKLYNGHYDEIFPDPRYRTYNMEDGEYLLKEIRITKARLLNLFPDKKNKLKNIAPAKTADGISTVTEENPETGYYKTTEGEEDVDIDRATEGTDYTRSDLRKLYNVRWCDYKKYEQKVYTIDEMSGELKDVTDKKLSTRDLKQMTDAIPYLSVVRQKTSTPWRAVVCGDVVLENEVSQFYPHIKSFPAVPYVACFTPIGKTPEKIFQGLIRSLKDPQNEINKRYSQLLNSIANAPWVGDRDALTPDGKRELEKFGSSPRGVYWKKEGSDLHRERPVVEASAYAALVQGGSDALKRISNVNMDVFGAGKGASGQALAMREKLSIMAIQDVYDNLRYSRHILAKFIIGMILATYTPQKIVRVCGEKKIDLQQAEKLLGQFDMAEYDLAIGETSFSPAMRMAVSEELIAMREAGILPPQVADEQIIEASSIPNKQEIITKMQQIPVEEEPQA